jgi:hypothetical protein
MQLSYVGIMYLEYTTAREQLSETANEPYPYVLDVDKRVGTARAFQHVERLDDEITYVLLPPLCVVDGRLKTGSSCR